MLRAIAFNIAFISAFPKSRSTAALPVRARARWQECWLEGGGVKHDPLRFRRAQGLVGVASSSATHEARAGREYTVR
ncbi:MAG: hypothetical protein ACREYF_13330 [Gammaproteobacteria bacterium]